jgi:WD40 repeat protein
LDGFGNINIWNFHSGELLKKIEINKIFIYDILLWNKKYLFLGCSDYTIKLIELDNYKVIKTLIGHNDIVQNLTKIIHPKFGECLLSQGKYNGEILLWFKNCISN